MSKSNGDKGDLINSLLNIEIELRCTKRNLKTLLRCRQSVLEHGLPETSDFFLDGINSDRNEIERLKKEIFKFTLANGTIF